MSAERREGLSWSQSECLEHSYYDCAPTWNNFYRILGANVVVSPATTKTTIDAGVSLCVDDACLPVKIYFGHAVALAPLVDFLFVPRLVSIERGKYLCPKFLGLPDMVKAVLGERTHDNANRRPLQIGQGHLPRSPDCGVSDNQEPCAHYSCLASLPPSRI